MEILIGLGANLGDPEQAFRQACARLAGSHRLHALSGLYRTRPVGPQQPDFLNVSILLESACAPLDLLAQCLVLEREAGRDRADEPRWGPRLLDIDLLIARDLVHRGPRLELPHPRLHERAFALVPAAELAAGWVHPLTGRTIGDLARDAVQGDPGAIRGRMPFTLP